ncbi:MAG: hypothetical protein NW215_05675 [Hyphomicrobiales bacterium]|nr:hypothetical protein [Hyphomicrobiales bacterium]
MKGFSFIRAVLALAALSLFSSPAEAQSFPDRYFPNPESCYARAYDAAHMTAHPRQTVTRFSVRPAEKGTTMDKPGVFEVDASFRLKNRSSVYAARGICTPLKDRPESAASCGVEGDGGLFELRADGSGVTVRIPERLEVEGTTDFSPNIAEADNRVIKLYPAKPADCP